MRRPLALAVLLAGLAAPTALAAGHTHASRIRHAQIRHAANQLPGTFFIRGGGDGHGIGMSQYGALGYAEQGYSYQSILAHYYTGTALGQVNPNTTVRVLLSPCPSAFSGASQIDGRLLSTPATHTTAKKPKPGKKGAPKRSTSSSSGGAGIASVPRLNPSTTYTVRPAAHGALAIFEGSREIAIYAAPISVAGPGPLTVPGFGSVRGTLEFRPSGSGVQTVNALGVDDYVRGVIGLEESASWPAQALEAQAVAARTYALTTSVDGNGFTLYRDTRSQMYGGISAESSQTDAAVNATRGQVVTYDGQPVTTFFFASSGGYTENIEDAWPGSPADPWLRGVPDPYDAAGGDPYHSWSYTMSLAQAAAKLGSAVKGSLIGVEVTKHGASPRILEAEVVGTGGTTTVTGDQLQSDFSLLTTLANFTSVIDLPGVATSGTQLVPTLPTNQEAKLFVALAAQARPGIHGAVFPAHVGDQVTVQEQTSHGWSAVQTAPIVNDEYSIALGAPGTYRAVYGSFDGPAVNVG